MTLKADRDALIEAAAGWQGVASEFSSARLSMLTGDGRGSEFGGLATLAGINTQHDTFITDMLAALSSGQQTMSDIAQALIDTATDFGATDTSVADTFHNEDGTPA
jgi:hypothetical protein